MRLLIVCTGNICRSPMAEVVVRRALEAAGLGGRVAVASAGTWTGTAGRAVDPRALAAAARRGYDLSGFVARAVDRAELTGCELVLGMTKVHVQELEVLCGTARRGAVRLYLDFTSDVVEREVPDPFLGSEADFERALDLIELGAAGIVAQVRRTIGQ